MATKSQSSADSIYQLKITLRDIKPPIWRRVQVKSNITLAQLHDVIQATMGWEDYHLHQYEKDGIYYGLPEQNYDYEILNEKRFKLNSILTSENEKLDYEYDFGDSWQHTIELEKILAPEPNEKYPVCLAGKRACPPEDCGGIWGYEDLIEALRDPDHPEHEDMLEWAGEDFDPEYFEVDEVNEQLKFIK